MRRTSLKLCQQTKKSLQMNRMAACKILFFLLALYLSCGKCDMLYRRVGDEVSMKCKVPQNNDLEWKFKGELIIHVKGKSGTKRKGPSHIALKASISGEHLNVPNLQTGDFGVYSCSQKEYTVQPLSVFAKPGPVLLQSSDVDLHCDITGNPNTEVQWLRPNGEKFDKQQVIRLKSVTSKEAGQWTCLVHDDKFYVTLTVVGLQTKDVVEVPEGGKIVLPCSLSQSVSQRVVGGKWKADHLNGVSFPTLMNTEGKGLHWNGENSSKVTFTSGQLGTNYDVMLKKVQSSDAGKFVCTVEFDGGLSLTAETTLKVNTSGVSTKGKGKTTAVQEILNKDMYGVQLWIWIAVGASSVVLIGLIVVAVLVHKRNKRKKQRVRKLRSMRQPLTAKNYCQCSRAEKEVELGEQARPLQVPRQNRNPRTRTAGPNHTN